MKNRGKVSVIICCYNVSHWLETKRLSCIIGQSYSNLEIILVDDGSTDNTLSLCRELAKVDGRIKIITKENGGLGSARNVGLDAAAGEYVWFYDVDDEAELNLIERNVGWMSENQTEMNIFSYWCITPSQHLTQEVHLNNKLFITNADLRNTFVDDILFVPNGNGFAWNKFYRRSFIEKHHFRFGNQRIQQDELFNLQLYPQLERVYISNELLYHYYIYNTGNNRSRFIPNRIDIYISIYNGILRFAKVWELQDGRILKYANKRFYAGIRDTILFNTFHPDATYSRKERRKVIASILNIMEVKSCLESIKNVPRSVEDQLYYISFRRGSYIGISFSRALFRKARAIKHLLGNGEMKGRSAT